MSSFKDAVGKCAEGMKELATQGAYAAIAVGKWGARTVVTITHYAADGAKAAVRISIPFFQKLGEFLKDNKPQVICASIGFAAGATIMYVAKRCCGKAEPKVDQPQTTMPATKKSLVV
jgi:hypothetical protein